MKKRNISSRAVDKADPRYAEKGYVIRNLFGFLIVIMLLLITLVTKP
jgi:hypothetical protein